MIYPHSTELNYIKKNSQSPGRRVGIWLANSIDRDLTSESWAWRWWIKEVRKEVGVGIYNFKVHVFIVRQGKNLDYLNGKRLLSERYRRKMILIEKGEIYFGSLRALNSPFKIGFKKPNRNDITWWEAPNIRLLDKQLRYDCHMIETNNVVHDIYYT